MQAQIQEAESVQKTMKTELKEAKMAQQNGVKGNSYRNREMQTEDQQSKKGAIEEWNRHWEPI